MTNEYLMGPTNSAVAQTGFRLPSVVEIRQLAHSLSYHSTQPRTMKLNIFERSTVP